MREHETHEERQKGDGHEVKMADQIEVVNTA
jgi:hypothetical protein